MAKPFTAVVYDGVRYPVTHDVAEAVISRIDDFQFNTHSAFFQIPTTDGREVVLRLSQSMPIAIEAEG